MSSPNGRKPKSYFIRTFGCQMNVHDTEHIAGVLEESGWFPARDTDEAELVVLNTCSVRKSAEDGVWGNLGRISSRSDGLPRVAVCGCMAQRYGVEILRRFPVVELVFGLDSLARLPALLKRSNHVPLCDLGDINCAEVDSLPSRPGSLSSAWVPVSHGCNNNCSYCVVPQVRGGERSRPLDEVVTEVVVLAGRGVIEVTLLGQNVNSYGRDLEPRASFARLLELVACVPGIRRVKFETSHPRDLSEEILQVMAGRDDVCEYLHLPVQSGSDRILADMNRGYTGRQYMELVERARELVPGLTVSTDIIVGFPGESEEDFQDTFALVESVGFDSAYLFIYSCREGTEAALMRDDAPTSAKSDRFKRLNHLQNKITAGSLERMVGREFEVLVEGPAKRGDYVAGRTRGHQVVLLPASEAPIDSLVNAEVISAGAHAVRGSVKRVIREPVEKRGQKVG